MRGAALDLRRRDGLTCTLAAALILGAVLPLGCIAGASPSADTTASPQPPVPASDHGESDPPVLGARHCRPPSPVALGGIGPEGRLTPQGIDGWVLLYEEPPWTVGEEVKVIWRLSGSGDVDVAAIDAGGRVFEPAWGPSYHDGSNWDRPGDEWGTSFILDAPGCWELRVTRDEGSASLWLEALAS